MKNLCAFLVRLYCVLGNWTGKWNLLMKILLVMCFLFSAVYSHRNQKKFNKRWNKNPKHHFRNKKKFFATKRVWFDPTTANTGKSDWFSSLIPLWRKKAGFDFESQYKKGLRKEYTYIKGLVIKKPLLTAWQKNILKKRKLRLLRTTCHLWHQKKIKKLSCWVWLSLFKKKKKVFYRILNFFNLDHKNWIWFLKKKKTKKFFFYMNKNKKYLKKRFGLKKGQLHHFFTRHGGVFKNLQWKKTSQWQIKETKKKIINSSLRQALLKNKQSQWVIWQKNVKLLFRVKQLSRLHFKKKLNRVVFGTLLVRLKWLRERKRLWKLRMYYKKKQLSSSVFSASKFYLKKNFHRLNPFLYTLAGTPKNLLLDNRQPSFVSLSDLQRYNCLPFELQLLQLFRLVQLEQILLLRWKKLVAFCDFQIQWHTRVRPSSQYWNIQVLTRSLQKVFKTAKQKKLKFQAWNSDFDKIEPEFVGAWFHNHHRLTIMLRKQDISYQDVLEWFDAHPWLLETSRLLQTHPAEISTSSFFDINLQQFGLQVSEQLNALLLKRAQLLNKTNLSRLKKLFNQIISTQNFKTVLQCDVFSLRNFSKLAWGVLFDTINPCLVAYPQICSNPSAVVWNRIIEYAIVRLNQNVQILKEAVKRARIIHLVVSLKKIAEQVKKGIRIGSFQEREKKIELRVLRHAKHWLKDVRTVGFIKTIKWNKIRLWGWLPLYFSRRNKKNFKYIGIRLKKWKDNIENKWPVKPKKSRKLIQKKSHKFKATSRFFIFSSLNKRFENHSKNKSVRKSSLNPKITFLARRRVRKKAKAQKKFFKYWQQVLRSDQLDRIRMPSRPIWTKLPGKVVRPTYILEQQYIINWKWRQRLGQWKKQKLDQKYLFALFVNSLTRVKLLARFWYWSRLVWFDSFFSFFNRFWYHANKFCFPYLGKSYKKQRYPHYWLFKDFNIMRRQKLGLKKLKLFSLLVYDFVVYNRSCFQWCFSQIPHLYKHYRLAKTDIVKIFGHFRKSTKSYYHLKKNRLRAYSRLFLFKLVKKVHFDTYGSVKKWRRRLRVRKYFWRKKKFLLKRFPWKRRIIYLLRNKKKLLIMQRLKKFTSLLILAQFNYPKLQYGGGVPLLGLRTWFEPLFFYLGFSKKHFIWFKLFWSRFFYQERVYGYYSKLSNKAFFNNIYSTNFFLAFLKQIKLWKKNKWISKTIFYNRDLLLYFRRFFLKNCIWVRNKWLVFSRFQKKNFMFSRNFFWTKAIQKNTEIGYSNFFFYLPIATNDWYQKFLLPLFRNSERSFFLQTDVWWKKINFFLLLLYKEFYFSLLSDYVGQFYLNYCQTQVLEFNSLRLKEFLNLLTSFYEHYYQNKKLKTLPNEYALTLIYNFFLLTGQKKKVYLRKNWKKQFSRLSLRLRFTNRKTPFSVRKKKVIYKLKILFDRLFLWLYGHKNIRFLFGKVLPNLFVDRLNTEFNLIYRKSHTVFLKKILGIFFLYGPLLQFDISERSFTCVYDITYLFFSISDFDLAVFFIILAIFTFNVSEFYTISLLVRPPLRYTTETMIIDLLSEKNYNIFDLINVVFVSIFLANFSGLIPYSQTITSQLLVTLVVSLVLMFGIWLQGFFFNKVFFWSHFLPSGSPLVIIPFIILIELVSNSSRIVSLSVRLFANMTSGHALLKILSGFALIAASLIAIWKFLIIFPVLIIIIITALEMLIAFLQTYVLVTIVLIYLGEQE